MIIDFKSDKANAMRHDVVCAGTGDKVNVPIWYADDERCVLRSYVQDDDGNYLFNEDRSPRTREFLMPIRIVPKSPAEVAEIEARERQSAEYVAALRHLVRSRIAHMLN